MIRRSTLSSYARERIKLLTSKGASVSEILIALNKDGVVTCRQTMWHIIQHLKSRGNIQPLPKSGRRTVLTNEVLNIIDISMQAADDETTAKQLCTKLSDVGILISERTVLKGRHLLGWTSQGTAYCQLIQEQNKLKRFDWTKKTLVQALKMLYGLTKQQFNLRLITDFVAVKKVKSHNINLAQSIL